MNYYGIYRKVKIGETNYYQLFKVTNSLGEIENISELNSTDNNDFVYSQILDDQVDIFKKLLYQLILGKNQNNEIAVVDIRYADYGDVINQFKKKYNDFKIEASYDDVTCFDKSGKIIAYDDILIEKIRQVYDDSNNEIIDDLKDQVDDELGDIYKTLSDKIYFQKDNLVGLANAIYLNRRQSSKYDNKKISTKPSTIFISGPKETGKKTMALETVKLLGKKYSVFNVGGDFLEDIEALGLKEACINNFFRQIKDDLDNKSNCLYGDVVINIPYIEDEMMFEDILGFLYRVLNEYKSVTIDGQKLDVSHINYIISLDDTIVGTLSEAVKVIFDKNDLYNVIFFETPELTKEKLKYIILFSDSSALNLKKKEYEHEGVSIIVEDAFLDGIIDIAMKHGKGIGFINNIIKQYIDSAYVYGKKVIRLTKKDLLLEIQDNQVDEVEVAFEGEELVGDETNAYSDLDTNFRINYRRLRNDYQTRFEYLKEYVKGQDEALKCILQQFCLNAQVQESNVSMREKRQNMSHMLIQGNAGSGKTYITTMIAETFEDKPCIVADATEYTEAGYVGKSVEDMLIQLYLVSGKDIEKAQKGILIIDEFDKLADNSSNRSDATRGAVQDSLLKLLEGNKYELELKDGLGSHKIMFDTSELQVYCLGAFEGLDKIRDERIKKISKANVVGFGSQSQDEKIKALKQENSYDSTDYKKYGIHIQGLRRLKNHVELKKLTKEDFLDIALHSNSSDFLNEVHLFNLMGIEVNWDDDFMNEYIDRSYNLGYGVSGLGIVLQKVIRYAKIAVLEGDYQEIILTKECIDNPLLVKLIKKDSKKLVKK